MRVLENNVEERQKEVYSGMCIRVRLQVHLHCASKSRLKIESGRGIGDINDKLFPLEGHSSLAPHGVANTVGL